jgi:hypothetical protein
MTMYRATADGQIPMTPEEEAEFEASRAPAPLTAEDYVIAVQAHLDAAARYRNYDDIVSACSYAGAPNPFQAEAQAFITWRGKVWEKCYSIMDDVESGKRTAPTIAGLIAELPALVLP